MLQSPRRKPLQRELPGDEANDSKAAFGEPKKQPLNAWRLEVAASQTFKMD